MTTDGELRDFLLGRLPEREAERLEARLVDDEEAFLTACSIEDDLFDAFARGELGAADREAFVRKYGHERGRLTFARALGRRRSALARVVRRPWVGLAAAAALVAAVSGLLTRAPQARPPAPEQGPVAVVTAPTGRVVPLALALGTSRGEGGATAVNLPADASTLMIRVRLDPADRFEGYAAELRSSDGRPVWSAERLHATTETGDLVLRLAVPARTVGAGAHELAVRGGGEDLGFVALDIRRSATRPEAAR